MGKTKKGIPMPTMPPEAMSRPKPKMPHAQTFGDLPKPVVPKTENRKLLKGQKAIVTGASSGIGRSIALALGHAGASVCVNYVAGEDKAQAMVDELRGHGHTAFAFKADVSSEDDVAKMFEAVRDEFGTVDILINNAGSFVLCRQNYLHQLGARSDPMGRSRELRGIERRRDANDEKHRPGSCSLSDPRELDCPWRDSNADQYASLGHAGALQRTAQI